MQLPVAYSFVAEVRMSHVVQIKTQVKDAAAVRAGCKRLALDEPTEGEVWLFNETTSGLAVQLRDMVPR